MQELDAVFKRLETSSFRQRFHLRGKEQRYLHEKGLDVVMHHAADFIEKRLAAAYPAHDGKQTPFRNHPVFIAQHATGTCCRSCLERWHSIPKGKSLDADEKHYILSVLKCWLSRENERYSMNLDN